MLLQIALCLLGWFLFAQSNSPNLDPEDDFRGIPIEEFRARETSDTILFAKMVERDALTLPFLNKLAVASNITIVVLTDRPEINHLYRKQNIYVASVAADTCRRHGFSGFGTLFYITKDVTTWDKALYFFSKVATNHRFAWFLEKDVYIPSIAAFQHVAIVPKRNHSIDLVVSSIMFEDNDMTKWHWRVIKPILPTPWYHTMAATMGMSRRLLSEIEGFIKMNNRLQFLEYLPLTLAMQNKMTIYIPPELETIMFFMTFTCEDVVHRSTNWFHPVKNVPEFMGNCIESGEWSLDFIKGRHVHNSKDSKKAIVHV